MTDERTTAYLLEELTERETEQFEEELFAHPEWPDAELDSAEQELIQAYLRKELSPKRQRRFEEKYLTTEARKERVLLARSFQHVVCSPDPPQPAAWWERFLKALTVASQVPKFAGILLAVGLSAALLWSVFRTPAPQTFAELNLVIASENRAESGPPKKLTLPLKEDALKVSLTLPEPSPGGTTYRVQWEDVKGPLEDLKIENQNANPISVVIPVQKLSRGLYTLKLFRKTPDGTEQRVPGNYFFEIE